MTLSAAKRVYVAGHLGMVGSAITRQLNAAGDIEIITRTRRDLDLINQSNVFDFFDENKIDQVYLAAAKVGGIHANNTFPAEFIYNNLMIQNNIIEGAHRANIEKLLFLGSSCIYPKQAEQPMGENSLLTGPLEPTNEPYAIAKIAGIKMCESYNRQYGYQYRSVMPTNLYGPGDNFHPENSHVIPALMRRLHEATVNNIKVVDIWGSGTPMREFLHVEDMAAASIFVMNLPQDVYETHTHPMTSHLNVGTGEDCTIANLAQTLADVIGYKGRLSFDKSKPDGTMRKLLDVSRLKSMGWSSSISLKEGLTETYQWFLDNQQGIRS